MSTAAPVPDDPVAKRDLHFFWIVDYSGSMRGKKIATVNSAIRDVLPEIRKAVATKPVTTFMRAIKFSDEAEWHVGLQPVPIEQFAWPELTTLAGTATAKAIRLLASELTVEKMPRRGVPPVCILLSDGMHTDAQEEYDGAISDLLSLPWGQHAVRLAIAIGENESDYDEQELLKFVSHKEIGLLKAHNPADLINDIRWTSLSAVKAVSHGKSKAGGLGAGQHVHLPPPPKPGEGPTATAQTEGFEI
jgi:uncharacterized protein YegL